MSNDPWSAVDTYIDEQLVSADQTLDAAIDAADRAGLPEINVAPNQGKFLHLLALAQGARNILEIGTLAGYSTIWLARAVPSDGRVVTLEANPQHAEVAQANIARAGLSDVVDVRVGSALDTLPKLAQEDVGPFDFVFIDADKANNPGYADWALRLARPGSVIIIDNVVRDGDIVDASSGDPSVAGTRKLFDQVKSEPRLTATAVQTVGRKGYDGFLMAVVR